MRLLHTVVLVLALIAVTYRGSTKSVALRRAGKSSMTAGRSRGRRSKASTLRSLLDGPRLDAWKEADVHAVVALRHGTLVCEGYFTRIGAGGWDR